MKLRIRAPLGAASHLFWAGSLTLIAGMAAACSAGKDNTPPPGNGTGGTTSGTGGTSGGGNSGGGGGVVLSDGGIIVGSDVFPSQPILQDGITEGELAVFSDPEQFSPTVCVHEPQLSTASSPGALFPMNWLRPRFRWTGTGSETLWEIRMTSPNEANALVAYTRDTEWKLPKDIWEKVAKKVYDPITVTIRGTGPSGIVGARGDFRIAPVLAGGAMVFWGTSSSVVEPGSSQLYGFAVGDEGVVRTLGTDEVAFNQVVDETGRNYRGEANPVAGFEAGQVRCVGCHSATPDGKAVSFTDDWAWNAVIASVDPADRGAVPAYVSAGAQTLLKMPFIGTQTMSPAHWEDGNRLLLTTFGKRSATTIYVTYEAARPVPTKHDLMWIDLETASRLPLTVPGEYPGGDGYDYERDQAMQTREDAILAAKGRAWGTIRLTGETGSVSNPDWSNDGTTVAYTSSETSIDGHPDWHNNTSDIKLAPFDRVTSTPVPLAGASDPAWLEYYPAFSPDDTLIAFTRAPAPSNTDRCKEGPPQTDAQGNVTDPGCRNLPATLGENPDGPYYNRKGEIYVVPAAGGDPVRLVANDPVACSGETSPGVLNSWPKWSSAVRDHEGKKYYFVIFSSARTYPGQTELTPTEYTPPILTKSSQLYMAPIEVDANGAITTYPAIYLWNQNTLVTGENQFETLQTSNLTPAWEDFSIPEVPPFEGPE